MGVAVVMATFAIPFDVDPGTLADILRTQRRKAVIEARAQQEELRIQRCVRDLTGVPDLRHARGAVTRDWRR